MKKQVLRTLTVLWAAATLLCGLPLAALAAEGPADPTLGHEELRKSTLGYDELQHQ